MAVPSLLLAAAVVTWPVDAGTTGALVEDHRAPVVSIALEFPVGSWSPWSRAHEAATAFELMNRDPGRALEKRADALAADVSLTMGTRGASFKVTCLKRDFEAALELVQATLANTTYDEHELKRERRERAILRHAEKTDVGAAIRRSSVSAFFDDSDPRRRSIVDPEPVGANVAKLVAARDALIRFPGRVVGFAGDLTQDDARAAAARLLPPAAASLPAELAPELQPLIGAAERPPATDVRVRRLTQVYLAYTRDSVPWTDSRRPAAIVADYVLSGHFYARLYAALRHDDGDTYGAGTRDGGDVAPGLYAATTYSRLANAPAIEAKLRDTLRIFRERGITEAERTDALSALSGQRAFRRQSSEQILARWMTEHRFGLSAGFLDGLVDRASALSLDEINAFIRDYYDPAAFSMFRAVP